MKPLATVMASMSMAQQQEGAAGRSARVEIYTWRFCPFCIRAKGLLDRKGVIYSEYAIDGDDAGREAMIKRSRGRSSVPQIFINNKPIGGCDELHALEAAGELDAMLAPTQA